MEHDQLIKGGVDLVYERIKCTYVPSTYRVIASLICLELRAAHLMLMI